MPSIMTIMMPFNSLLPFFLLLVAVVSDSDRCYAPNGDSVDDVASCWRSGLCCRQGDLCLNSTLCVADLLTDTPSYYRGSCLDRNWEDPTCPNFCLGAKQSDGAEAVFPCTDKGTEGRWYCDGDGSLHDACGSPDDYFELSDNMVVYATAGMKPEPSAVTSSAEESSTATGDSTEDHDTASSTSASDTIRPSSGPPAETTTESSSVQPSVSSPPLDTATETTSVEVPSSTSPASSTSSPPPADTAVLPSPSTTPGPDADGPSSSTPAPSDAPQDDGKSTLAVPIGVGVAVGASVLIAASVLVFFYQRKRRRQAPVRAETPPPFEFEYINSQAPDWLGPSYGAKPPGTHGANRYTAEGGSSGRVELP